MLTFFKPQWSVNIQALLCYVTCSGAGTRKGNGQCSCDKEYGGKLCDTCGLGYYNSYSDSDTVLCSPCHKVTTNHNNLLNPVLR